MKLPVTFAAALLLASGAAFAQMPADADRPDLIAGGYAWSLAKVGQTLPGDGATRGSEVLAIMSDNATGAEVKRETDMVRATEMVQARVQIRSQLHYRLDDHSGHGSDDHGQHGAGHD